MELIKFLKANFLVVLAIAILLTIAIVSFMIATIYLVLHFTPMVLVFWCGFIYPSIFSLSFMGYMELRDFLNK